jgi:hypothetical protein
MAQRYDDVVDHAPLQIGLGDVGRDANRDPNQRQQNRVGNREPLGQRGQKAHEPEHRRNGEDGKNGFVHDRLAGPT